MFNVLILATSDPPNTSITQYRLCSGSCTRSYCAPCQTNVTPCWLGCQGPSPTDLNRCSTWQPEWSVESGSSIAACPNCFTPSYIGWTFHNVTSINSESQFTSVCRIKLLSTWLTTARVHRPSQAANSTLDRPTVTSWWFHNTVPARLVVGLSPSPVRWNGTNFHTHSWTLLGVPTASSNEENATPAIR